MKPKSMAQLATPMTTVVDPRTMEVISIKKGFDPENGPPKLMETGLKNAEDPALTVPSVVPGEERLLSCEKQCIPINPQGVSTYFGLKGCVLCDACQSACSEYTAEECLDFSGNPKDKCSSQFGSCAECAASPCAREWKSSVFNSGVCGSKTDKCARNLACLRLNNCVARCFKGKPCDPNPCQNGGSCSVAGIDDAPICDCVPGFNGALCNESCPYDCDGKNCGDDGCGGTCGECADEKDCSPQGQCCPAGFAGDNCSANINDCFPNPCEFGACTDGVNSYECTCDAGYHGANCDTPIGQCVPTTISSIKCDPTESVSCDSANDKGCDQSFSDEGVAGFQCFSNRNQPIGQTCSLAQGPYCIHGGMCYSTDTQSANGDGTCRAYCCDNSTCASGQKCTLINTINAQNGSKVANPAPLLGICVPN